MFWVTKVLILFWNIFCLNCFFCMTNPNSVWPVNQVQQLNYVPSSSEKKRAIVMYLLFGIMIMVAKSQMTVFEYYHLKQAVGWWTSFMMFFVVFAVLLFIPFIKFLGLIPLLVRVVLWWIFLKQSRDWIYFKQNDKGVLQFVSSIWAWLLSLFEVVPTVIWVENIPSMDIPPVPEPWIVNKDWLN